MDNNCSSPESDHSASQILSCTSSDILISDEVASQRSNSNVCPVKFDQQSPIDTSRLSPQESRHLQNHGPQPISPPPPSPQISAAELLLLTETSATNNGTFQCTLCSKQFGYKNGLIRHVRLTHVGEKPYLCSICNRRFGYKHILMEHQNLHFGNRPYACTLCDKRFAARSNLIQHRMVHRRPFNCALCNKRFDREDQLKKHVFAHPQTHAAANRSMKELYVMSKTPLEHTKMDDKLVATDCCSSSPGLDVRSKLDMLSPRLQLQSGSVGHRIDAICSQLSTSIPSNYSHLDLPIPTFYQGFVVKKEVTDIDDPDIQQAKCAESNHQYVGDVGTAEDMFTSCNQASSSSDAGTWSSEMPRFVTACADVTTNKRQSSQSSHLSSSSSSSAAAAAAAAALPGIHEMFSKRTAGHKLPSFANFMPAAAAGSLHHSSLPMTDLSAPFVHSGPSSTTFSSVALSGIVTPTQRPTAQLPPITQAVVRSTKDQSVQHSHTVTGFPSLDDVLAYYVSQGRLFRCQHCSILFFERGMYFLHASLHGLASPWECSICHKVCSDKNEFTLHFVNQQHHP